LGQKDENRSGNYRGTTLRMTGISRKGWVCSRNLGTLKKQNPQRFNKGIRDGAKEDFSRGLYPGGKKKEVLYDHSNK